MSPLTLQTITIAQMLYVGGEGDRGLPEMDQIYSYSHRAWMGHRQHNAKKRR